MDNLRTTSILVSSEEGINIVRLKSNNFLKFRDSLMILKMCFIKS